jgi:hypothetical protein
VDPLDGTTRWLAAAMGLWQCAALQPNSHQTVCPVPCEATSVCPCLLLQRYHMVVAWLQDKFSY